MSEKTIQFNNGFTLIETFVAVTILLIAVLGPLSVISKFYVDNAYAKNQIAGAFIAQDGLETVQNIIKNNTEHRRALEGETDCASAPRLEGQTLTEWHWLWGLAGCLGATGHCSVSSLDGSAMTCVGEGENVCLVYKTPAGFLTDEPNGNNSTIFRRQVNILPLSPPADVTDANLAELNEAIITSTVWWNDRGRWRGPITTKALAIQPQCP